MTDDPATNLPDDDDETGTAVCPKCMNELAPSVDFCPNCRAPVTSFANTGYLESALAQGWGMGEAIVTKSPSLVHLIGLWLLLLPFLVFPLIVLFVARGDGWTWEGVIGRVVTAVILCFVVWCLQRATRNYVRARRAHEVREPDSSETEAE